MAAVMMSVLKKGSRNASDNERESDEFIRNYGGISGVRFPSTDTVDEIMRRTEEKCSEKLKTQLVKILIINKNFYKKQDVV